MRTDKLGVRGSALLIGNSDGIGLAATRRLLAAGWTVAGISRSVSPVAGANYRHIIADVSGPGYPALVADLVEKNNPDLCVYFAGIGEFLNLADMGDEVRVFEVNLTGMIKTAAAVIPRMVQRGSGHFIGISSLADELAPAEAPSYSASKAGFTSYLAGLAQALKPEGVSVTTVRFGYVDTKMAKDEKKPFLMSVEKAVDHLEICIRKKPVRYTAPALAIPLVKMIKLIMRIQA
ncbi:MAG: SDR family oxidoreductase [Smithellaceae bacterium]